MKVCSTLLRVISSDTTRARKPAAVSCPALAENCRRYPSAARAADETRDAGAYAKAQHYAWGGSGDGSRSADEMRALELLGLDPDADFDATKKAWRAYAKECHPDVKPGDADAARRFAAGQAAFEVLKQAEERKSWKPA